MICGGGKVVNTYGAELTFSRRNEEKSGMTRAGTQRKAKNERA